MLIFRCIYIYIFFSRTINKILDFQRWQNMDFPRFSRPAWTLRPQTWNIVVLILGNGKPGTYVITGIHHYRHGTHVFLLMKWHGIFFNLPMYSPKTWLWVKHVDRALKCLAIFVRLVNGEEANRLCTSTMQINIKGGEMHLSIGTHAVIEICMDKYNDILYSTTVTKEREVGEECEW